MNYSSQHYVTSDIPLTSPAVIVWFIVFGLGIAAWLMTMIEWIGVIRWWAWAFRIGVPIWRSDAAATAPAWLAAAETSGAEGVRIKRITDSMMLAITLGTNRWPTNASFVNATIHPSNAPGRPGRIQVRTSVFPWLFMILLLLGFHIAILLFRFPLSAAEKAQRLAFAWAVCAGSGAMMGFFIRADLRKLRRFVEGLNKA